MIRIIIILVFIQGFLIDSNAQSDFHNRHIYAMISDFYYLDILPDMQYSLKVGMYGDNFVKGDYKINGDTLKLVNFDFLESKYELSENEKLFVKGGFSSYLIIDSLLIPIQFRDLIPRSKSMLRDSTIISEYIQNDGHANYKLTFHSDSTFKYRTGTDVVRHFTKGTWTQKDNMIKLYPDDSDVPLYFICTENEMIMVENYLVGKTVDKEDNIIEFNYLIGLKPAANSKYK
jgi:hypothetical protein